MNEFPCGETAFSGHPCQLPLNHKSKHFFRGEKTDITIWWSSAVSTEIRELTDEDLQAYVKAMKAKGQKPSFMFISDEEMDRLDDEREL